VAGLLGEEGAMAEIAKAQTAFEDGDERLAASDYGAAADLFAEAVELYEAQVAEATRFFRDEPLRVAATVRGMREGLDALEQELYDRLAVATARLESCEAGAGGSQTEEEREAIADCRRNAENEVQLMEQLIELTRENVLSGPPRQAIADGLDRADSLLNEGRYRAALTAYAEVKAGLAELLAWPERAEEALRRERAVSQEIGRFRSALAAAGRDESEVEAELDGLVVQIDHARDVLAGGEAEEAMALFETVGLTTADLRAATVERLFQQAQAHEAEGHPSAAVSTIDELLAFNPGHAEGEALRERILSRRLTNVVGMELVFIPPGDFRMGSPASEPGRDDDERMRDVEIAPGFYMSSTEVTQAQWLAVMGEHPSRWEGDALPVEGVSWADAVAFCEELSRVDGRSYRLPTEAEWEYACRAGTTTPFSFGRFISPDQANYDGRYGYANGPKGEFRGQTVAVGSFPPNPWGLHDMHGNVWEWCLDVYKGEPIDTVSAAGEEPSRRHALRGGSWRHRPMHCRCANRVWAPADSRLDTVGFRVVLESE
jgi:formylglycine-generating enzyme required for sulfatase activity